MLKYRISIAADRGLYSTAGAIKITASHFPMIDAARALLARGADPQATLAGSTNEGGSVSPVTLARLARAYSPPRFDHRKRDVSRNLNA